jgi:nickel-dependent lactate racemase
MRVAVSFRDEQLDFEVPEDRLVGVWRGPEGVSAGEAKRLAHEAIENPLEFPPLRQAVVPGDQVVIALDPQVPESVAVLEAVCEVLEGSGVAARSIQVLASGPTPTDWPAGRACGIGWEVHDPAARAQFAYLASTEQGRRIYLNRRLTDADFIVPIGLLGHDPVLGDRGPWGVIFPGLSDLETQRSFRAQAPEVQPESRKPNPSLAESLHVNWLLGSQFQVGVVPGAEGLSRVIAGRDLAVRAEGRRARNAAWVYRAPERAELVVAGIGRPDRPTTIDDLAEGLATAAGLVRQGGKIVALSRTEGPIGPALRRLADADDARGDRSVLRGLEHEADYPAARQLARTLAWADVYLLSALDPDDVDDLSMIALGHPEEARRLAAVSSSCLFLSQSELTRGEVGAED